MINYLIELSVIHVSLLAAYWLFLREESQYAKMRSYLIGSTLLALVIPLLKLPKLFFHSTPKVAATTSIDFLPIEAVTFDSSADVSVSPNWFWGIYGLISAFFLIKFLGTVIHLIRLEHSSKTEKLNDLTIRKASNIEGSFTFFNWIFISDSISNQQQEYDVILRHEKAHASLGHTYDLLLFELFKVAFWWLPSAWFTQKEIKKIHEYQADAYALQSYNIDRYSSILISSTLKSHGLSLASSFHDGLILKRLKAMKQTAKNVSPWKIGSVMVLGILLFVGFACSEEADNEIKKIGEQSNSISFDQLPQEMQENLKDLKDNLSFIKVNVNNENQMSKTEELQKLDPKLIHAINVDKENKSIYIALKKDGDNFDYVAEKSKSDDDVFTLVEKQPQYEGGMTEFYSYVQQEMTYPEQARKEGVEGKVYVQFVVETDGSLSEVKAVKGIGAGCDAEAVRVIKSSKNFTPGEQRGKAVRVRMVMPIAFQLSEDKQNEDGTAQGMIFTEVLTGSEEGLKVMTTYADGAWTGTVSDADGNPLPGANIIVAGTNSGTVADLDGSFKIEADKSSELAISFVGYETVKVKSK